MRSSQFGSAYRGRHRLLYFMTNIQQGNLPPPTAWDPPLTLRLWVKSVLANKGDIEQYEHLISFKMLILSFANSNTHLGSLIYPSPYSRVEVGAGDKKDSIRWEGGLNTWCQDSWLPHSWSGSHSTLQCTAAHPRQEVQWGQSWIIAVLCRAAQCALHLAPPPLLCKLPTLYSALYCSVQYASEEESVQCCTLSTL